MRFRDVLSLQDDLFCDGSNCKQLVAGSDAWTFDATVSLRTYLLRAAGAAALEGRR